MAPDHRPTEKYRPRTLAEIVGQPMAVERLSEYASAPYPTAFLFSGPTGVGKTTAARALARELGAHPEAGIFEIESARADVETVDWIADQLRFTPWGGLWRVFVIDEADTMSEQASRRFLSALEAIPDKTVFVWTTNNLDWFRKRQRILDRLEHVPFAADPACLDAGAREPVSRIWVAEGAPGESPALETLPWVVGTEGSYRRLVSAVAELARDAKGQTDPFALRSPGRIVKDLFGDTRATSDRPAPRRATLADLQRIKVR